jgi:methionyl-tRNA formyltransferase
MKLSARTFVYAANNRNGFLCGRVIADAGYRPELLLLHPKERRMFGDEIRSLFPGTPVVEWGADVLTELKNVAADVLLSVNYGYIFTEKMLRCFRYPVNLHTGYLPYNKGSHPHVWSIVEGTPAGVALHLMTPEVDVGEIIARREITVSPLETGGSLYAKQEKTSVDLIGSVLPHLLSGEISTFPMPEGGTFHLVSEFVELCAISSDETVKVGDLFRRLRALSFPPHKNAYLVVGGKRVYFDISLEETMDEK